MQSIELSEPRIPFDMPEWKDVKWCFPFKAPRPYQDIALRAIIGAYSSGYRYVFLEAPTGFGKSPMAMALSNYFNDEGVTRNAYLLVSTKMLQDQYLKDFDLLTVKGRSNFRCLNARKPCSSGMCRTLRGFECSHSARPTREPRADEIFLAESASRGALYSKKGKVCPYWEQKCNAINDPHPIFNYDYFLNETQYVGDFGSRPFMVCDEAHNIESRLMAFIGLEITTEDLHFIREKVPKGEGDWLPVLSRWESLFRERLKEYEGKPKLSAMEIDRQDKLQQKTRKISLISSELREDPENWSIEVSGSVSFKPIYVRKWGSHIFSKSERFLLQSATLLDPDTIYDSLGLEGRALYIRVPSIFSPERRRFIYRGVANMTRSCQERELPYLVGCVKRIIQANPHEKGVIHTHSFRIQEAILSSLKEGRLRDRIVHNRPGKGTQPVFRDFMVSDEAKVLLTPSAYEGVDFKGPACRWQVLCKVPYPSLEDLQIRKRVERDPGWYSWLTVLRLIQTYGRGMRSEEDFCRTYMLDSHFPYFFKRNRGLFPEWFTEAIRQPD